MRNINDFEGDNGGSPACVGLVLIYASVSFSVPAGFGLLAFGDIAQFSLLFIAFVLMVANAVSTRGQVRLFWADGARVPPVVRATWPCGRSTK